MESNILSGLNKMTAQLKSSTLSTHFEYNSPSGYRGWKIRIMASARKCAERFKHYLGFRLGRLQVGLCWFRLGRLACLLSSSWRCRADFRRARYYQVTRFAWIFHSSAVPQWLSLSWKPGKSFDRLRSKRSGAPSYLGRHFDLISSVLTPRDRTCPRWLACISASACSY